MKTEPCRYAEGTGIKMIPLLKVLSTVVIIYPVVIYSLVSNSRVYYAEKGKPECSVDGERNYMNLTNGFV